MKKQDEEKRKCVEEIPEVPPGWDRCHAYIPKRKRFCRQQRFDPSNLYCGNHQTLNLSSHPHNNHNENGSTIDQNNNSKLKQRKRRRVPCPLDPSHDIFEDKVEKHLKICPAAKLRKRLEEQPFFCQDINTGGYGTKIITCMPPAKGDDRLEWAKRVARRVLEAHQEVFGPPSSPVKDPIQVSHDDILNVIPTNDYSQQELDLGMMESIQEYRIRSGGAKHVPQIASLVGHLRTIDALKSNKNDSDSDPVIFLEMGAGRGMFGLAAAGVANAEQTHNKVHLAMIERTGSKGKADTVLRTAPDNPQSRYMNLKGIEFSRIECDLSHVGMSEVVRDLKDGNKVAIAKHLCGAGTDLALKSLEPIKKKGLKAIMMATCCHGLCTWDLYCGRDTLIEVMEQRKDDDNERKQTDEVFRFGSAEFELLRVWSQGTVLDENHQSGLIKEKGPTVDQEHSHPSVRMQKKNAIPVLQVVQALGLKCGVQGLGRACQRLIDYGRQQYIQEVLFDDPGRAKAESKIEHYVSNQVTPQNALLVGHWKHEDEATN